MTTTTSNNYSIAQRSYAIRAYGLRPSTAHDFYFDGVKRNEDCQQITRAKGDTIITTAGGEASFTFFLSYQIPSDTEFSDYISYTQALNNLAGDKIIKLVSLDGNSVATSKITYQIELSTTEYFGS